MPASLSRAICTDLSITCTIQAWPWEQAGKALEDGQGDAECLGPGLRRGRLPLAGIG